MVEMRNQSYLNTLVFTVIAEGITVLVIGLLVIPFIRPYAPFLVTLEIGLIVVILWTLYAIHRYHRLMARQFRLLKNTRVMNVPCPDYYVRDADDDGNLVCKNEYTAPNGRLKIKFMPNGDDQSANEAIDEIKINDVFQDRTLQDVCQKELSSEGVFAKIPWSSMKPNCPDLDEYDDYEDFLRSRG